MKVLLDTNIIIHRETPNIQNADIGLLFFWIDKLKFDKYIHHLSIEEINRYKDSKSLKSLNVKIESYIKLKHSAPWNTKIDEISARYDQSQNDITDTHLLNEVLENRVDILISEDKKIHKKAVALDINNKVFSIQSFLEKVISENPEFISHKVLSVKKVEFGDVNLKDPFFDSFRMDYSEFEKWFNKKSEQPCYICNTDNKITAFLYLKVEKDENYSDIKPVFAPKKRLKIGTFKVSANGYKLGERFLRIIFENALLFNVEEIYVTIFRKRPEHDQLIELLEEWGFYEFGNKTSLNGIESVFVRPFGKSIPANIQNPKHTYPFFSRETNKYLVKIEPQYHTELFPDSINTREDSRAHLKNGFAAV